jgi:uncharacterized membrane protein YozB (DUF420 family)
MREWVDAMSAYAMFGATVALAIPFLALGVWLIRRRNRALGWTLVAAAGLLAALFPASWVYMLVIVMCTGRNGDWIC